MSRGSPGELAQTVGDWRCREKAPFMLLVEVLSNDQGSVREDAKYSAGSTSPPPHTLPRKATQAKTVPRPYTPDGREQRNGHRAEGRAVTCASLGACEGFSKEEDLDEGGPDTSTHLNATAVRQVREGNSLEMMPFIVMHALRMLIMIQLQFLQGLAQVLGAPVHEDSCCCADDSECGSEALAGPSCGCLALMTPAAVQKTPSAALRPWPAHLPSASWTSQRGRAPRRPSRRPREPSSSRSPWPRTSTARAPSPWRGSGAQSPAASECPSSSRLRTWPPWGPATRASRAWTPLPRRQGLWVTGMRTAQHSGAAPLGARREKETLVA